MPLFPEQDSLGRQHSIQESKRVIIINDPLSTTFEHPPGDTSHELVIFMLARQRNKFGKTIIVQSDYRITQDRLMRNMKLLMEKYPIHILYRGIELANKYSRHLYTTKHIKNTIERFRNDLVQFWISAEDF